MLLRRYHKKKIEPNKNDNPIEEPSKEELLNNLTVPELKEIAKEKGIKGYSNMKKEELISALAGE